MKMIVGLGNPGSRYKATRHNIGFCVTDALVKRRGGQLKKKLFSNARQCSLEISGHSLLVVQPLSYMNLSGEIVLKYAKKFKIEPGSILVVYDDIDLPLGFFKIKPKGSSGGHNGMGSVIQSLRTENISRLRMGISTGHKPADLSEYVLSDFKKIELPRVRETVEQAALECERWIEQEI